MIRIYPDLPALPPRIQLRRTKDWRLLPGAVVVSRPTKWGNPFDWGIIYLTPETG